MPRSFSDFLQASSSLQDERSLSTAEDSRLFSLARYTTWCSFYIWYVISTTRWCRLPSLQLGAGPEQATSLSGPEQAILQCCWDPLRRAVAFVADTANVGGHDVKRKDGVLSFAFMCTSELGVTWA